MSTNKLVTKKKNIQGIIRVRPMNTNEIIEKSRNIVSVDQIRKSVIVREKTSVRNFGPFDKVLAYTIISYKHI